MASEKQLVRFDWFVKYMLRDKSNFEVLEGFLFELLKRDIVIIEILDSESNKSRKEDKFNRVDILAKDADDERIIIEIQNNKEYDYLHRILYGTAKALVETITAGEPYSTVKKIISVSVVYFEVGQGLDYIYHGQTSFTGIHQQDVLTLSAEQEALYGKKLPQELYPEYYLIKAADFDGRVKDTLDEWVYFFKRGEIKPDFNAKGILKAKKKLDVARLSPAQRKRYDRFLEAQHDLASYNEVVQYDLQAAWNKGITEGFEKGIEQGIEKGIEKGIEQGIEKGVEKGIEQGIEKGRIIALQETAINLLRAGVAIPLISQVTGLAEAELLEIAKTL
ncbi:MAG: PD-(D/E)XK nuclease family transposase [Bacteroidia bacterium]|nr:PD-(D/E)XK nuclease family transposase [Bacteroidia bacterium]